MLGAISKIWSVVSANPAAFAALAASLSAIVALMSPFVAFGIAKKQIRASVVSTNRQAWINGLRDDLSEMLELAGAHFYLREGTLSGEEGFKYGYEQRTRLWLLQHRIRLRLNADETPNQELLFLLGEVRRLSVKKNPDTAQAFEQAIESAIEKAQRILKAEWKRVKTGR